VATAGSVVVSSGDLPDLVLSFTRLVLELFGDDPLPVGEFCFSRVAQPTQFEPAAPGEDATGFLPLSTVAGFLVGIGSSGDKSSNNESSDESSDDECSDGFSSSGDKSSDDESPGGISLLGDKSSGGEFCDDESDSSDDVSSDDESSDDESSDDESSDDESSGGIDSSGDESSDDDSSDDESCDDESSDDESSDDESCDDESCDDDPSDNRSYDESCEDEVGSSSTEIVVGCAPIIEPGTGSIFTPIDPSPPGTVGLAGYGPPGVGTDFL